RIAIVPHEVDVMARARMVDTGGWQAGYNDALAHARRIIDTPHPGAHQEVVKSAAIGGCELAEGASHRLARRARAIQRVVIAVYLHGVGPDRLHAASIPNACM